MMSKLETKLTRLPKSAGVYFHKNKKGDIIYIGKAANLRNRVRQYFQNGRTLDPKTTVLISEIADIDWLELETEADALFLEAELVRRYQPRFNIMLRDDKSLQFVRIDYKSDHPTVSFVRRPLDDKAYYFGPYLNGWAVKKALRYLRRAFPYAISRPVVQKRVSLDYHLGLDPGLEEGYTSLKEYRANLKKLMQYLKGERKALAISIEREMNLASTAKDFEKAAKLRNQLFAMRELNRQILFSDRENLDASRDMALKELSDLIGLSPTPRRIEGFDISHLQGADTSASMVVFVNGVPEKMAYRKFKIRAIANDDFGSINQAVSRRLSPENIEKWGKPDLMLIDGGKGQLSAALKAREAAQIGIIPMIGLAKKREQLILAKQEFDISEQLIITKNAQKLDAYLRDEPNFLLIELAANSHLVKLLQRIRDESHRFAVSYHTSLRRKRQTASLLDEIPGVGPATRKKLIRKFGSTRGVLTATENDLQQVLGKYRGLQLFKYLNSFRQPQV